MHGGYAACFGAHEAAAIRDMAPAGDPLFFVRNQDKVVEPEDAAWAL